MRGSCAASRHPGWRRARFTLSLSLLVVLLGAIVQGAAAAAASRERSLSHVMVQYAFDVDGQTQTIECTVEECMVPHTRLELARRVIKQSGIAIQARGPTSYSGTQVEIARGLLQAVERKLAEMSNANGRRCELGGPFEDTASCDNSQPTTASSHVPPQPSQHLCHSHDFTSERHGSCAFRNLCVVPGFYDAANVSAPVGDNTGLQFFYIIPDHEQGAEAGTRPPPAFSVGIGYQAMWDELFVRPKLITAGEFTRQFGSTTDHVRGTSIIYHEYNAQNFGHMLGDVLLPLFALQESFGEANPDVNLYQYWPKPSVGASCENLQTIPEQGRGTARGEDVQRECMRLEQLMTSMVSRQPVRRLDGLQRPTCFDRALVGMAMLSVRCMDLDVGLVQDKYSLCNHGRQRQFWRFRTFTKANLGLEDVVPTQQQVVLWQRDNGRGSELDMNALVAYIHQQTRARRERGTLNGAATLNFTSHVVDFAKLPLAKQVRLAGESTVHITGPGGGSFIAMYLPQGATTIRLYPTAHEYRMEWNFFNYLGFVHVEHVPCFGTMSEKGWELGIPYSRVLQLVLQSFERYKAFGKGGT